MSEESNISDPLVSVVIPTYNRPSYLREALKSVVQQTYQNIEIIVSDNCSPENPQEIIDAFQDPRIKFWRNSQNIGLFANATGTIKKAKGKYVANLCDDDLWEKDYLEKLVKPLEANPNLSLAFCDHYVIDSQSNIDYEATQKCSRFYKRDRLKEGVHQPFWEIGLVHRAVFCGSSAVVRRDAINWDQIPTESGGAWDLYLIYLCCRSGMGAYYVSERLSLYREHEQTDTMLSGSKNVQAKIRKAKAEMFCYRCFMEDEQLQDFRDYFRRRWLHANTTLGIGLLRAEQAAEARPYLWLALSQQKFNLRTLVAIALSFTPWRIAKPMLSIARGAMSGV